VFCISRFEPKTGTLAITDILINFLSLAKHDHTRKGIFFSQMYSAETGRIFCHITVWGVYKLYNI